MRLHSNRVAGSRNVGAHCPIIAFGASVAKFDGNWSITAVTTRSGVWSATRS
jgi:hypothetical protein